MRVIQRDVEGSVARLEGRAREDQVGRSVALVVGRHDDHAVARQVFG
jgi:hypothetical protein